MNPDVIFSVFVILSFVIAGNMYLLGYYDAKKTWRQIGHIEGQTAAIKENIEYMQSLRGVR